MITLSYNRQVLSAMLQIAQQCWDDGQPLPCWLVEQVAEAHDNLLVNVVQQGGNTVHQKSINVGAIDGPVCKTHGCPMHRAECGKIFCPDCLDEGGG